MPKERKQKAKWSSFHKTACEERRQRAWIVIEWNGKGSRLGIGV